MDDRPEQLSGTTIARRTACGKVYATCNFENGNINGNEPKEVIINLGKAGGCPAAFLSTLGRVISIALQHGVPAAKLRKQLTGVRCHAADVMNPSCIHAVGEIMTSLNGSEAPEDPPKQTVGGGACPDCGASLRMQEGCATCSDPSCGYSKCS